MILIAAYIFENIENIVMLNYRGLLKLNQRRRKTGRKERECGEAFDCSTADLRPAIMAIW